MKCEHARCYRRARHSSPANWCGTHWRAWWNFAGGNMPKWMREPNSRWVARTDEVLTRAAGHNT